VALSNVVSSTFVWSNPIQRYKMFKPKTVSVSSLLFENMKCVLDSFWKKKKNCSFSVAVQCDLSEWSLWGPCMKKNKTCGFKKGNQTRTREPVQIPSPATSTGAAPPSGCVPETQTQRCTVQKKIPCKGKSEKEQQKNVGKRVDRKYLRQKKCVKSAIQLQ